MSIQSILLQFGSYVSQDLVRQSVDNEMIGAINCGDAIERLGFTYEAYRSIKVDPKAYLLWLKQQLSLGHPAIWYVYCKGDPNIVFDHIEPVFGIYSNTSLANVTAWSGEDVLVHNSAYDQNHYYRTFDSLLDARGLNGNCKLAPSGHGHNEMYPCVPNDVPNSGYAVTGLVDPTNRSLPAVSLSISSWSEPDLDQKQPAVLFNATVRVKRLTLNQSYVLLRWDDVNPCPGCPGFRTYVRNPGVVKLTGANYTVKFRAQSEEWQYADPVKFLSSGATYYRCIVDDQQQEQEQEQQ